MFEIISIPFAIWIGSSVGALGILLATLLKNRRTKREKLSADRDMHTSQRAEYFFHYFTSEIHAHRYDYGYEHPREKVSYGVYLKVKDYLSDEPEAESKYWTLVERHIGKTKEDLIKEYPDICKS